MPPSGGQKILEVYTGMDSAAAKPKGDGSPVKGLYRKARSGQFKNFTGIDSPYEALEPPELRIDATRLTAEQAADAIVDMLIS